MIDDTIPGAAALTGMLTAHEAAAVPELFRAIADLDIEDLLTLLAAREARAAKGRKGISNTGNTDRPG